MNKFFTLLITAFIFSTSGFSITIYWTGANYFDLSTFTQRGAPTPADSLNDLIIGAAGCVITSDASVKSISVNSGDITLSSSSTLTISGNVTINSGTTFTINNGAALSTNGVINNNGTVTINTGGNLIQTGTGSNSITTGSYQVSVSGSGTVTNYNLWSAPTFEPSISGVFGGANQCDVYYYNASSQVWTRDIGTSTCLPTIPASGDGNMNRARGYSVAGGSSITFSSNSINNNAISIPIVANGIVQPGWSGANWNLIGNPYPSSINGADFLNNVTNSALFGTIYFWDDDGSAGSGYDGDVDFATWNLGGGTAASGGGSGTIPDGSIATGQGFFVQATSSGSAQFTNSMRGGANSQFFKSEQESPTQRIWLNAKNSANRSTQILLAFTENATNGMDWGYDSKKFITNNNFVFGSTIEGIPEPFVIQSLNKSVLEFEKEVNISLSTKTSGVVSIEIDNTENLDTNVVVFVKDYQTGKIQNLNTGPFSVYLKANQTYDNRFSVLFKNESGSGPTGINSPDATYLSVYNYEGQLYIKSPREGLKSVDIIDINGRVMESFILSNNESQISINHLKSGFYFARVLTESGNTSNQRFVMP